MHHQGIGAAFQVGQRQIDKQHLPRPHRVDARHQTKLR